MIGWKKKIPGSHTGFNQFLRKKRIDFSQQKSVDSYTEKKSDVQKRKKRIYMSNLLLTQKGSQFYAINSEFKVLFSPIKFEAQTPGLKCEKLK